METVVYVCAQKEGTHTLQVYSYNRHGQRQSEGSAMLIHVGIKDEARTEDFLRTPPTHLLI